MDGRVKTLHPKLYAGLARGSRRPGPHGAGRRSTRSSSSTWSASTSIRSSARPRGATSPTREVIENIDIGGPTMIRAAAKNHAYAAVLVKPESYDAILMELAGERGLAVAADARGARGRGVRLHGALRHGDRALVRRARRGLPAAVRARLREGRRPALRREPPPARRVLPAGRRADRTCCRRSASTRASSCRSTTCSTWTPLVRSSLTLDEPACAIVKHNNPCGVAVGKTAIDAYERALECDPLSAFGGVIALNRPGGRGDRSRDLASGWSRC